MLEPGAIKLLIGIVFVFVFGFIVRYPLFDWFSKRMKLGHAFLTKLIYFAVFFAICWRVGICWIPG